MTHVMTTKQQAQQNNRTTDGKYTHRQHAEADVDVPDGVDGVAAVRTDWCTEYRNHAGQLHNPDGPALLSDDGELVEYRINGELHREDGPAKTHYGKQYTDDPHRIDEWHTNGKLHRLDGPAVENHWENDPTGWGGETVDVPWEDENEYWVDGAQVSRDDFPAAVASYRARTTEGARQGVAAPTSDVAAMIHTEPVNRRGFASVLTAANRYDYDTDSTVPRDPETAARIREVTARVAETYNTEKALEKFVGRGQKVSTLLLRDSDGSVFFVEGTYATWTPQGGHGPAIRQKSGMHFRSLEGIQVLDVGAGYGKTEKLAAEFVRRLNVADEEK